MPNTSASALQASPPTAVATIVVVVVAAVVASSSKTAFDLEARRGCQDEADSCQNEPCENGDDDDD